MSTENRRVATYLPKEVDEKFKAFQLERGIKGDSQALLAVLTEFLGVTESLAPSMNIQYEELSQQLSDLQTKFASLESELFSRLKSELLAELSNERLDSSLDSSRVESLSISVPGQLSLLTTETELPVAVSAFKPSIPELLTGDELAKRLQANNSRSLRDQISRHKNDASHFPRWSSKHDPDGIAWERFDKGLYRPIQSLDKSDPAEDF